MSGLTLETIQVKKQAIKDAVVQIEQDLEETEKEIAALREETLKKSVVDIDAEYSQMAMEMPAFKHEAFCYEIFSKNLQSKQCLPSRLLQLPPIDNRHAQSGGGFAGWPVGTLPLYQQPSEVPGVKAAIEKFRQTGFREKLIEEVKKRRHQRFNRERYLLERYNQLQTAWQRKMDRVEKNAKRVQKQQQCRELFERLFPEIRRSRDESRISARLGRSGNGLGGGAIGTGTYSSSIGAGSMSLPGGSAESLTPGCMLTAAGIGPMLRSEAEFDHVVETLQEREAAAAKRRALAVVPPLMLDPSDERRTPHLHTNGRVGDLRQQLRNQRLRAMLWTKREQEIFRDKFAHRVKDFAYISAAIGSKSVSECIQYYYETKHRVDYKALVKRCKKPKQQRLTSQISNSARYSDNDVTKSSQRSAGGGAVAGNDDRDKATDVDDYDEEDEGLSDDESPDGPLKGRCSMPRCASGDVQKKLKRAPASWYCLPTPDKIIVLRTLGVEDDEADASRVAPGRLLCAKCRNEVSKAIAGVQTATRGVATSGGADEDDVDADGGRDSPASDRGQSTRGGGVLSASASDLASDSNSRASPSPSVSNTALGASWRLSEVTRLKRAVLRHGRNWNKCASMVSSKSRTDCRDFYFAHKSKLSLDLLICEFRRRKGGAAATVGIKADDGALPARADNSDTTHNDNNDVSRSSVAQRQASDDTLPVTVGQKHKICDNAEADDGNQEKKAKEEETSHEQLAADFAAAQERSRNEAMMKAVIAGDGSETPKPPPKPTSGILDLDYVIKDALGPASPSEPTPSSSVQQRPTATIGAASSSSLSTVHSSAPPAHTAVIVTPPSSRHKSPPSIGSIVSGVPMTTSSSVPSGEASTSTGIKGVTQEQILALSKQLGVSPAQLLRCTQPAPTPAPLSPQPNTATACPPQPPLSLFCPPTQPQSLGAMPPTSQMMALQQQLQQQWLGGEQAGPGTASLVRPPLSLASTLRLPTSSEAVALPWMNDYITADKRTSACPSTSLLTNFGVFPQAPGLHPSTPSTPDLSVQALVKLLDNQQVLQQQQQQAKPSVSETLLASLRQQQQLNTSVGLQQQQQQQLLASFASLPQLPTVTRPNNDLISMLSANIQSLQPPNLSGANLDALLALSAADTVVPTSISGRVSMTPNELYDNSINLNLMALQSGSNPLSTSMADILSHPALQRLQFPPTTTSSGR